MMPNSQTEIRHDASSGVQPGEHEDRLPRLDLNVRGSGTAVTRALAISGTPPGIACRRLPRSVARLPVRIAPSVLSRWARTRRYWSDGTLADKTARRMVRRPRHQKRTLARSAPLERRGVKPEIGVGHS